MRAPWFLVVALLGACGSPSPDSTGTMTDVAISPTGVPFGFRVCAPRPLPHCVAAAGVGWGTRVWPRIDIAATPACETQMADVTARCGDPAQDRTQDCFAAAGVLLDPLASRPSGARPALTPTDGQFLLSCAEGGAAIGFAMPL